MKRGFKIAKGWENKNINIPKRQSTFSAGYDIEAAEQTTIPPFTKTKKPTLVKTGIKAYMEDDEYLMLANRSSNPLKKDLVLANGIGIIDKDYYENEENDGHIMFTFYNLSEQEIIIKKGERIGQAIFQKYLKIENDNITKTRTGGFGSTNKKLWN